MEHPIIQGGDPHSAQPPLIEKPMPYAILWLVGFFAFCNVYPIQVVLPLVRAEFDISIATSGLLIGVALFAIASLSPFIGLISDSMGRKKIICACVFLSIIPNLLIACTHSLSLLFIARFFQGLLVPGIIVVTMAYIGEEFPKTLITKATTAYVSGTIVGGFSGRFLVGHMANTFDSWRDGYFVLITLLVIAAILIVKVLPQSRHFHPNKNIKHGFIILRVHLNNGKLIAACMVGFCVLFAMTSCFTYMGYYLQEPPFNLDTGSLSNIFIIYLFSAFITSFSSVLTSRLGNRNTIVVFILISATGLCLTLYPHFWIVIAGITIFASGMFICQAASISFIGQTVKHGRSLATGLYNLSYYAGGAIGSLVAGFANDLYHWPGTVFIIIAIQIICAVIAFIFWKPTYTKPVLAETSKPIVSKAK